MAFWFTASLLGIWIWVSYLAATRLDLSRGLWAKISVIWFLDATPCSSSWRADRIRIGELNIDVRESGERLSRIRGTKTVDLSSCPAA